MTWRVWLAFGALGVIWGVPYFFIRIAVQDVPPLVVAWSRITLAALIPPAGGVAPRRARPRAATLAARYVPLPWLNS